MMKLKLIHKLLIAMVVCAALVLVLATLVTRASIGKGFVDFLKQQEHNQVQQLVPELADWYGDRGSWDEMAGNPRVFFDVLYSALPPRPVSQFETGADPVLANSQDNRRGPRFPGARSGGNRSVPRGHRGGPNAGPGGRHALPQRIFLLDDRKNPVVGMIPVDINEDVLLPIEFGGSKVGWLGFVPIRQIRQPAETAFVQRLRNNLLISLGVGLLVAVLLAWLLARHLSRPIKQVAEGVRVLASGDFESRLDIKGSDEIAKLGVDVNRLSATLKEHETTRKRWMSDMAHELRTPLAIISGELEAMNDGVRPLGKEQLDSLRDEVKHLSVLVDDLHSLTLTDSGALAYKMHTVDLGYLVQIVVDSFQARVMKKGLELNCTIPEHAVKLHGDEQRLRQLLRNLLDNSVRYTDAGGRISVTLKTHGRQAQLVISDTAPGAGMEECERLFERLYRVEGSRNRNSGGSGLGLAICRNIVDAHGGQISAEPGPDGGLMITTLLPLEI